MPTVSLADARETTFPDGIPPSAQGCLAGQGPEEAAIRCLLRARFDGDAAARDLALALFDRAGDVTGVIQEHTMNGGWRGSIHLVPELPVGRYRKHLEWVLAAFTDIDQFFAAIDAKRPKGARSSYRHRALSLRFMRSVGRTTPSAYANSWFVAYNVSGSLHGSADAVRETLFHELFHANDAHHGDWSERTLSSTVEAIVEKCGQKSACLRPYAPGTTMVRGGTYYAFQKGNGVGEYAAELAVRYYVEQTAALGGRPSPNGSFKCGPPENAKAWQALVEEFFGVDLTAPCKDLAGRSSTPT